VKDQAIFPVHVDGMELNLSHFPDDWSMRWALVKGS